MVELRGVEPRTSPCKGDVFPTILQPHINWCLQRESNPHSLRNCHLKTACLPIPPCRHYTMAINCLGWLPWDTLTCWVSSRYRYEWPILLNGTVSAFTPQFEHHAKDIKRIGLWGLFYCLASWIFSSSSKTVWWCFCIFFFLLRTLAFNNLR